MRRDLNGVPLKNTAERPGRIARLQAASIHRAAKAFRAGKVAERALVAADAARDAANAAQHAAQVAMDRVRELDFVAGEARQVARDARERAGLRR